MEEEKVEEEKEELKLSFGAWTFTTVGVVAGVALIMGANLALDAYVLTKLWAWFIVPAFAVPYISKKAAAGISMIVALTSHQARPMQTIKGKDLFFFTFGTPLLFLLAGWIITKL